MIELKKEHLKRAGFTLVELIVSLFIIAILSATVAAVFGNLGRDADVICAVNEMKTIKDAITDYFYPDLGIVPLDFEKPWHATRYLCLTKDPKIEEKFSEITYDSLDIESREMCKLLAYHLVYNQKIRKGINKGGIESLKVTEKEIKDHFAEFKGQLKWDKLYRRGWNGPYVEADAAYKNKEGNYLPVVANPWATKFEDDLKKAYKENNQEEIDKWEAASFYWILGGQAIKEARIICFGSNGKDDGSFHYKDKKDGLMENKFATADDLNDLEYDIGDDIVMFIFSGRTRSPLK